jgi:hypothetical protein
MRMPSIALMLAFILLASANSSSAKNGSSAPASRVTAIRGTLEKVDTASQIIVVKTGDGGDTTLHFTDATVVHGLGPLRSAAMLLGDEGMEVIVRYTNDKVARSIVLAGGASLDLAIGTVVTFDRRAKTLQVSTVDGTRQLFQLGEFCTINTARGVEEAITAPGHVLKKGGLVVLYFTQEGGQKVVRAIDEISHSG